MKGPAERDRHGPIAIPAGFNDFSLDAGMCDGVLKRLRVCGGIDEHIELAFDPVRLNKRDLQFRCQRLPFGVTINENGLRADDPGGEIGDQRPTTPAPKTATRSPG